MLAAWGRQHLQIPIGELHQVPAAVGQPRIVAVQPRALGGKHWLQQAVHLLLRGEFATGVAMAFFQAARVPIPATCHGDALRSERNGTAAHNNCDSNVRAGTTREGLNKAPIDRRRWPRGGFGSDSVPGVQKTARFRPFLRRFRRFGRPPGARAPRSRRQTPLGDQQVGEAQQQRDPLRVPVQPPVANLAVPEHPLHMGACQKFRVWRGP